jgi:uncharacterized membrane protein (DUF485 family)
MNKKIKSRDKVKKYFKQQLQKVNLFITIALLTLFVFVLLFYLIVDEYVSPITKTTRTLLVTITLLLYICLFLVALLMEKLYLLEIK